MAAVGDSSAGAASGGSSAPARRRGPRVLFAGLGGGLDVLNASVLFSVFRHAQMQQQRERAAAGLLGGVDAATSADASASVLPPPARVVARGPASAPAEEAVGADAIPDGEVAVPPPQWVAGREGRLARSSRPGYGFVGSAHGGGGAVSATVVTSWVRGAMRLGVGAVVVMLSPAQLELYAHLSSSSSDDGGDVDTGLAAFYRSCGLEVEVVVAEDLQSPPLTAAHLAAVEAAYVRFRRRGLAVCVHCSAGIDRTGAAVAHLLRAGGPAEHDVRPQGRGVLLGSVRPRLVEEWIDHVPFAQWGAVFNGGTCAASSRSRQGRYPEPRVSELMRTMLGDDDLAPLLSSVDRPTAVAAGADVAQRAAEAAAATDLKVMARPENEHADAPGGVVYFGREPELERTRDGDLTPLVDAFDAAATHFGLGTVVFVDGGGDSLILHPRDAVSGSEGEDPFLGGDAVAMAAYERWDQRLRAATSSGGGGGDVRILHAVTAVGLDVSRERFAEHVAELKRRGAYYGRLNLHTGQKDDWTLTDDVIPGASAVDLTRPDGMDDAEWADANPLAFYDALADQVLAASDEDLKNPLRWPSHTATVTRHARNGRWGAHHTFVPWARNKTTVDQEHAWVYFFDAPPIERLKMELNNSSRSSRASANSEGAARL